MTTERFKTFKEFYPFYLGEHQNTVCRYLHFQGTVVAIACMSHAFINGAYFFLLVALIQAYTHAWIGHFFFEKNKPATFKYPIYSFIGDWVMFWELLTRKIPFNPTQGAT